ncbi:hypothetical protein HMPREF3229_00674 [Peptoniphilus harei]|uniref:ABC-2 family transporter protein n=1 Tax=Peptoniphilus harei TaxID=54005 RepID=A0A133PQZ9_9FIRM|nr:hypothetical protein [Peptoniphilus harei]KXA31074.1 hypothetical protein HMPREF3229_00674 [Peptoniphilus harei]
MVIKLIGLDLKKTLDKNALLMAFFGLVFTYLSSFPLEEGLSISRLMGIEGLAFLFLIFALEFSKASLQEDKAKKKIEFVLANGLGIKFLVIKYFGAIYLSSLITLLPAILLFSFKTRISVLEIFNFLLTSGLYTNFLILKILNTVNMNKMAGIQNKIILLGILILMVSINIYIFTSMIKLYLISKFLILITINIFVALRTNKERIGVTYF